MERIIKFSKNIGNDIINFQATGGNISFKKDNFLYIKSSGYRINDIYKNNTLSKIDINGFFLEIEKKIKIRENSLFKIIKLNNKFKLKSSIETGFHLLLDSKYIIHTHNIYINVLLCMKGINSILKNLFGKNISIIDYFSPGFGLFNAIKEERNIKNVIFLKNHGIILHGNNGFNSLYEKLNQIENKIIGYLKLDKFKKLDKIEKIRKHIFPDSIVLNDLEIYSAHKYIKSQIKKIGGNINYLTENEVEYIKNMAIEKYRKKLFNKKVLG